MFLCFGGLPRALRNHRFSFFFLRTIHSSKRDSESSHNFVHVVDILDGGL